VPRSKETGCNQDRYEFVYDCPLPTPMVLMLTVHDARASDLVVSDRLVTDPSLPIDAYHVDFGNWCSRAVAPIGRTRLVAEGNTIRPLGIANVRAHGQFFV